jgi:hypothetical protein
LHWHAGDQAVALPDLPLVIRNAGRLPGDMASKANAIGAATIKARQFFKRNLAGDL